MGREQKQYVEAYLFVKMVNKRMEKKWKMGIRGGKILKPQMLKKWYSWRRDPSKASLTVLEADTGFRNDSLKFLFI